MAHAHVWVKVSETSTKTYWRCECGAKQVQDRKAVAIGLGPFFAQRGRCF